MQVYISNNIDEKDWDNLLMKVPTSTAFQMSKNYDPYKLAFGSKPLYITVEDPKGNILAQLLAVQHFPNHIKSPNSFFQSVTSKINNDSTIYWHYGPIIHNREQSKEIFLNLLKALEKFSKENQVMMINGSSTIIPYDEQQNQFKHYGYKNTKWDTWVTDLKPDLDILYKSLNNKTRYDIRKGEKNNIIFEVVNDRTVLDEWMEIKYSDNKRKNEIIQKNKKFNDYIWEILYKPKFEKMYVVRLDGEIISGIANKLFNNNVVQHSIINSQKKLQGGSFLTWNTIKWSKENNFLTYDVGGANPSPNSEKEKGIRHYKSKWNGEEIQYDLYIKIVNKTKWKISKVLKHLKAI